MEENSTQPPAPPSSTVIEKPTPPVIPPPGSSPPPTAPPQPPTKPKNIPTILLSFLSIIALGAAVYFGYKYYQTPGQSLTATQQPLTQATPPPTQKPTSTPESIQEPITTPSPTPTAPPATYEEEEKMMRATLAGFEQYIAASNTAGALSFFTPPTSDEAKEELSSIRAKNLPFTLTSWQFVDKGLAHNYELAVDKIKNGYRVRMIECRSNADNCPILFIELVRSESAENGFQVDRYYDTRYAYQNNLGEEIKYQGFGFK